MIEIERNADGYLTLAQEYANKFSGCLKVAVGALIVDEYGLIISTGANRAVPNGLCMEFGCLRIEKYGENSKSHRNPEDCRAIHAEIDAIATCYGGIPDNCTLVVTRYPCETCAKAIKVSGITKVIYGREQKISKGTKEILKGVEVIWQKSWSAPDTTL